jgi:hypothetical protein
LTSPPEKPNLHMPGARRQAISTAFATRPSSPRSGYKTTPRALACSSQRWVSCQSANWASFQPALTSSSMCPPLGSDETIMAYEMPLGGCIHRISSDLSRGRRSCTMPGDTIARGLRKPRPAATYGGVPEWLNGAVSKTVELARVPRVRIPLPPPLAPAKAFSRSGCGRIFPLFSRVMRVELLTARIQEPRGGRLYVPGFSRPLNRVPAVKSLKHLILRRIPVAVGSTRSNKRSLCVRDRERTRGLTRRSHPRRHSRIAP